MTKVTLKGFIRVPNIDLASVLEELPNHIALTKNEVGCLVFKVTQDKSDLNRFSVYEEFKDKDSFQFHQDRVRESKWGKITKNVERNYNIQGL